MMSDWILGEIASLRRFYVKGWKPPMLRVSE